MLTPLPTTVDTLPINPVIGQVFRSLRGNTDGAAAFRTFTDEELLFDIADEYHRLGVRKLTTLFDKVLLTGMRRQQVLPVTTEGERVAEADVKKELSTIKARKIAAIVAETLSAPRTCGCGQPASHRVTKNRVTNTLNPTPSAFPVYCLTCATSQAAKLAAN